MGAALIMDDPHLALLTSLQKDSFAYFVHEMNEANGLVADKTAEHWPASIAAVGMALTVYTVGVERGFFSRERAARRTLTTLRFFANSEQSEAPDATGYKGFYYHFLDMDSGKRAWHCELSSIDTALLIAGVLSSRAYFQQDNAVEKEIRELADLLYGRVDWQWMLAGSSRICHGWKPESGFLQWHWEGYDEALILYLLALGSPTFPIGPEHYTAWTDSYEWKSIYGVEYLYAGPLFIHQMSHLWVDFRGIRDAYMRGRDCDYFENSRRATIVQQQYAIRNPLGFEQYSELCGASPPATVPAASSKKSMASSAPSSTTWRAARRSARTTAPWRRGRWRPACRSRPTSCCPACSTCSTCACASRTRTASRRRFRRPSMAPATSRPAGSRRTTSASTKARPSS
jgi:hypothetical protein